MYATFIDYADSTFCNTRIFAGGYSKGTVKQREVMNMKKLIGYKIKHSYSGRWYRARGAGTTELEGKAYPYTRLQIAKDISLLLRLRRREIILKPVYEEV